MIQMKNLTRKQLFNAIYHGNQYMAVRWSDGVVTGCNRKVALKSAARFPVDDTLTNIQGFYPISFHEYIRIKIGLTK